MERVLLKLQSIRVDTHRQLSEHFKAKVQLQEQVEDNDARLQFCRGAVAALDEMEKVIAEVMKDKEVARGGLGDLFDGVAMEKSGKIRNPEFEDLPKYDDDQKPSIG